MAFLYQNGRSSNLVTRLPEGLQELMADISREVLDKQPDEAQMCTFIANYLETLLEMRNRILALDDVLKSSIKIEDFLHKNGIDCQTVSQVKLVIQNAFRKYVNDLETTLNVNEWPQFNEFELFKELIKVCDLRSDELILVKIILRTVFKAFFEKYSQYRKTFFATENHDEVFLKHYAKKTKSLEMLNEAAIKIQACFRGYSVRKNMKSAGISSAIENDPSLNEFVSNYKKEEPSMCSASFSEIINFDQEMNIEKSDIVTGGNKLILNQNSGPKANPADGLHETISLKEVNFNGKQTDNSPSLIQIEATGPKTENREVLSKDSSVIDITPEAPMVDLTNGTKELGATIDRVESETIAAETL